MVKHFSNIPLEAVEQVIEGIFELGEKYPIWTFEGNLGAGKTTLIKGLAEKLGIMEQVSSPTFNYVNDYEGKIYHFDCYRIKSTEEALGFGIEEYLDSGKRCWIEWPEVIRPLILDEYLKIEIIHNPDLTRTYVLSIE